jgi:hypothetical protein
MQVNLCREHRVEPAHSHGGGRFRSVILAGTSVRPATALQKRQS